jgi:hypothetical protein
MRYLKGTYNYGIFFASQGANQSGVHVYGDADFAGDIDRRRSTTGLFVMLDGNPVSWSSKLQSIVATSTAEAEYIAAASAVREGLWTRKLLAEMQGAVKPIQLWCDNRSATVLMSQNTAGTAGRTKHIDLQFYFVRDRMQRGDARVEYIETGEQKADIFTKALSAGPFDKGRKGIACGKVCE